MGDMTSFSIGSQSVKYPLPKRRINNCPHNNGPNRTTAPVGQLGCMLAVVKRISRRFPDASLPEIIVFPDASFQEIVRKLCPYASHPEIVWKSFGNSAFHNSRTASVRKSS
jgi:hypothetical protein